MPRLSQIPVELVKSQINIPDRIHGRKIELFSGINELTAKRFFNILFILMPIDKQPFLSYY